MFLTTGTKIFLLDRAMEDRCSTPTLTTIWLKRAQKELKKCFGSAASTVLLMKGSYEQFF